METLNVQPSKNMNEIVFENRNKSYGAYVLRKNYNDNVIKGLMISSLLFATIVIVPTIISRFSEIEIPSFELINTPPSVIYTIDIPREKPAASTTPKEKPATPPSSPKQELAPVVSSKPDEVAEEPKAIEAPAVTDGSSEKTAANSGLPVGNDKGLVGEQGKQADEVPFIVAVMPEFPGGVTKYLSKNIRYPERAYRTMVSGTVYISFVVDEEGKVTDVKLVKGIGGGCDEEALEVVRKMPAWKPGRNEANKPVKVFYNLPVKFTLADG